MASHPYQSSYYNCRMDEAFSGLTGYHRIVDDVVIYDSDTMQHTAHIHQFLQRCREKKITLNNEKWKFAPDNVNFARFLLSANSYCIDQSITTAVSNFPTPTNRTDLRAFLGLVNQL